VRFRLVPRDQGFYPLFNAAAENVVECARRLRELLADFSNVEGQLPRIIECERKGDDISKSIEKRLNESFVTPFDREDILVLTEALDDVVDDILGACDLLVLHNVERPLPEMLKIADILLRAAETAEVLLSKLSKMRGMDDEFQLIDALESEADKVYRQAVARLFSGEYKAFDVLKWKDVFEALEDSINRIERVADTVQSVVLKHA
jgi:predicted phosphate transport protein (TIGR00153 family)